MLWWFLPYFMTTDIPIYLFFSRTILDFSFTMKIVMSSVLIFTSYNVHKRIDMYSIQLSGKPGWTLVFPSNFSTSN